MSVFSLLMCVLLPFGMCTQTNTRGISSNRFVKDGAFLCDVPERVTKGCAAAIPKSRSRIHCASLCERETTCIGASQDRNGVCFHHKECPSISGCTVTQDQHEYRLKYCKHGSWVAETKQCDCVDGIFGERCSQYYKTCFDLISDGYQKGEYTVYLDPDHNGAKPFLTRCYVSPPSYNSMRILANYGNEDFNKSWADYVNGFEYDKNHYWAGLYAWHRMSNAGYTRAVFSFKLHSQRGEPDVYRDHRGFIVYGERNGYSFTFQSSASTYASIRLEGANFGDCMNGVSNTPFSTWDSDRDGDDLNNCAGRRGSGWWFRGCNNPCNLLGFGIPSLGTKPRDQVFSLLKTDMSRYSSEQGHFIIYISKP